MMASMKEGYMVFWEHRDRTVLGSQRGLPGESRYVGGKKKRKTREQITAEIGHSFTWNSYALGISPSWITDLWW